MTETGDGLLGPLLLPPRRLGLLYRLNDGPSPLGTGLRSSLPKSRVFTGLADEDGTN